MLAASLPLYRGNPGLVEFWESAVSQLMDPIDPGFVRKFQESALLSRCRKRSSTSSCEKAWKVPARVWRAAFEGFFEDDFVGELCKIRAATLILWGDRDALCPRRDQDALLTTIAGSRLVVYEGAGHRSTGSNRNASPPMLQPLPRVCSSAPHNLRMPPALGSTRR